MTGTTIARTVALTLLVLAASSGDANAEVNLAWDPMAQQVARDYWGGNPPCGWPTIDHTWTDGWHSGAAYVSECRIGVDTTRFDGWAGLCALITHEYGHLFGHDHEPGTIMDADVLRWELVPGCDHDAFDWLVLRPDD